MIALDTNLLIYAHRPGSRQDVALKAVRDLAEGDRAWTLPPAVVTEFLAVVTGGEGKTRTPKDRAFAVIEAFTNSPSYLAGYEPSNWFESFREICLENEIYGHEFYDARVAAQCVALGVSEFWTADADFKRLGLPFVVIDPLVS